MSHTRAVTTTLSQWDLGHASRKHSNSLRMLKILWEVGIAILVGSTARESEQCLRTPCGTIRHSIILCVCTYRGNFVAMYQNFLVQYLAERCHTKLQHCHTVVCCSSHEECAFRECIFQSIVWRPDGFVFSFDSARCEK